MQQLRKMYDILYLFTRMEAGDHQDRVIAGV
jgi:hypothetical protein